MADSPSGSGYGSVSSVIKNFGASVWLVTQISGWVSVVVRCDDHFFNGGGSLCVWGGEQDSGWDTVGAGACVGEEI
jgi:hypothetical protein